MKQLELHVPYIPELAQELKSSSILNILETSGCRQIIDRLNWEHEYPYQPLTTFTIGHSQDTIYIDFFVRCNYLKASNYIDQMPVTQDSAVAVYISPLGNEQYYCFEFNCIGITNASRYNNRTKVSELTAEEISQIKRYPSCGDRPFCELEGLFSWNLLVSIPFKTIGLSYEDKPITVTGNFYKCASDTSQPHFMSWSPINTEKPDFHRPNEFGKIIFD